MSKLEQKLNELESLKLVLEKHFESDDIRDWVEEFEQNSGQFYTVEADVFGKKMTLDTTDIGILKKLADRIYRIRNALVHNKEGEESLFVPYTEHDDFLEKELPLLKFLSGQLIINNGVSII